MTNRRRTGGRMLTRILLTLSFVALLLPSLSTVISAASADDVTPDQQNEQRAVPASNPNDVPTVPADDPADIVEQPTQPVEEPTDAPETPLPTTEPDALAPTTAVEPDLVETGSVESALLECPPEVSLPDALEGQLSSCSLAAGEMKFSLNSVDGYVGTETGNSVSFGSVSPGSITIAVESPLPATTAVWCYGNTALGNTKPYARYLIDGSYTGMDLLPGETIHCDWYIPATPEATDVGTNVVIIRKANCPEGYDASTPDMYDLAANCHDVSATVGFSVFEAGGGWDGGVKTTPGVVVNQVTFDDVPTVPLWLYEEVPDGYETPVAYCGVEDQLGNDVTPTTLLTYNAGHWDLPVVAGDQVIQCDVFNIPTHDGGSVTVYKWDCVPGTEYGMSDPDYYPTQCDTEHLNIPITLTDDDGDHATTTQANGTQWDDVVVSGGGSFTITEELPDGYGDPVVYCQTLDDDSGSLTTSTGGTISITPASADFDYQCNWYNIPHEGHVVVIIDKYECPRDIEIGHDDTWFGTNCTTPMDDVDFTMTSVDDSSTQSTVSGQTQWDDVTPGSISITETIPEGYHPQPWVVCTFHPNDPELLILAEDFNVVNNTATLSAPHGGVVHCDWYNWYVGPGDLTVYKWTCPEGFDLWAWNADPTSECIQSTDGVTFILHQPADVDLQSDTGDSIPGAVRFGALPPGEYMLDEVVPEGIGEIFVWDCTGMSAGSVVATPLNLGPAFPITISSGDDIVCNWYNVPTPHNGWLTVIKYECTTPTYVSDIDCQIYEEGKTFDLQVWDGSVWVPNGSGTTDVSGTYTWMNLDPGNYKVVEREGTACHVEGNPVDGSGNLTVDDGRQTIVKVYNCGAKPTVQKPPAKYPNTGAEPQTNEQRLPGIEALGLATVVAGTVSRRRMIAAALGGAVTLGIGSKLAAQGTPAPIELYEQLTGTPSTDCLFPATPEGSDAATPEVCPRGAVPTAIRISKINVDAEIEVLEIVDGAMQQPTGEAKVAWYKDTARLGETGNVLLAGHLNWWGFPEAVFFALGTLAEGDAVELEAEDGSLYTYVVTWKEDFPSDDEPPADALGPTDNEAITMITCGGEWVTERSEYDHRTIVRAERST